MAIKRFLFFFLALLPLTVVAQRTRAPKVHWMQRMGVYTSRDMKDKNFDREARTYTFTNVTPHVTLPLWGYVYVETDPNKTVDFEVRVVRDNTSWADFHICKVSGAPCEPDWWHFVSDPNKAHFSIRFVEKDEHFTVRFVSMERWKAAHPPHTHGAYVHARRTAKKYPKMPVIDHHWGK